VSEPRHLRPGQSDPTGPDQGTEPLAVDLQEIGRVRLLRGDEAVMLAQAMALGRTARATLAAAAPALSAADIADIEAAVREGERARHALIEVNLRPRRLHASHAGRAGTGHGGRGVAD